MVKVYNCLRTVFCSGARVHGFGRRPRSHISVPPSEAREGSRDDGNPGGASDIRGCGQGCGEGVHHRRVEMLFCKS